VRQIYRINVFWHNFLFNNNWIKIFNEQFALIISSGLYEKCEYIHCCINEKNEEIIKLSEKYNKIKVYVTYESSSEYGSIKILSDFCKLNDSYILYITNKGVTYHESNKPQQDWRDLLNYFNITKFKNCLDILRKNKYNCVGVNCNYHGTERLDKNDVNSPHFSGNFWWSTSDYIKSIPSPLKDQHRYYYEQGWLYTGSIKFLPYSLHNSNVDHSGYEYPRKKYINSMKVYYRISDVGYKKVKAPYINNENCLRNFIKNFLNNNTEDIIVLADNVCESTYNMIKSYIPIDNIIQCNKGSGAQTFNVVLDMALKLNDNEIVYFVENDYVHRPNSKKILEEGFEIGANFVCLYDHPDKYINGTEGGNPQVENGGEYTQVFLSDSCHWKLTNSTTMTFASRVKTLRTNESILRKWTSGTYPEDYKMFLELRDNGHALISPIPSYSTHGDLPWMSPLINWEKEL